MSVTGKNISVHGNDIHTCNLDYDMQVLYVIVSRQNTKTNIEQKKLYSSSIAITPLQLLHATLMSIERERERERERACELWSRDIDSEQAVGDYNKMWRYYIMK